MPQKYIKELKKKTVYLKINGDLTKQTETLEVPLGYLLYH